VLGENGSHGPASLSDCQAYAAQYPTIPLSKFYVDSTPQAHEVLYGHLYWYPDSQGYIYFPWEAVLNAQTMEYVYSSGISAGDAESVIGPMLP